MLAVVHEAAGVHRRTTAERRDEHLSWARGDRAFFAAGACHILTWAFLAAHPGQGFRPVGLRTVGEELVWHVYATDEVRAFDYDGWTTPAELITVNARFEGKNLEQVDLPQPLEPFCAAHRHRLPQDYAYNPWPRARAHLDRLAATPAAGPSNHRH